MSKDTSTSGAQHAPEAVEQMAKRLHALSDFTLEQSRAFRAARLVLDRERILTDALKSIYISGAPQPRLRAKMALDALAAYDSPKQPTLREAVAKLLAAANVSDINDALGTVREAYAREEGGAK